MNGRSFMEDLAAVATKRPAGIKTSEDILAAARRLFLRQGFHATGMRQIAREAGIGASAIYNHFASKEEILEALLVQRDVYATMGGALSRARGDSVAELVESGFTEVMAALEGNEDFPLLLFLDFLEFQGRHVIALATDSIPLLLGFFQRAFVLGKRSGELRDVPAPLVARTFMGMVFSSFILESVLKALPIPLRVENWQRGMVDILLHGILAEGA